MFVIIRVLRMQEIKKSVRHNLNLHFERLALLPVIVVFIALLFLESVGPAFSKTETVFEGYSKDGLTYDYYLNSSYHYSSYEVVDVEKVSYETVETLGHIVINEPAVNTNEEIWDKIAGCESNNNWGINTGNGYYGGLQFSESAWHSVGGSGYAHDASREEQIMRGKMLQERRGWGVWGQCAKKLGL